MWEAIFYLSPSFSRTPPHTPKSILYPPSNQTHKGDLITFLLATHGILSTLLGLTLVLELISELNMYLCLTSLHLLHHTTYASPIHPGCFSLLSVVQLSLFFNKAFPDLSFLLLPLLKPDTKPLPSDSITPSVYFFRSIGVLIQVGVPTRPRLYGGQGPTVSC